VIDNKNTRGNKLLPHLNGKPLRAMKNTSVRISWRQCNTRDTVGEIMCTCIEIPPGPKIGKTDTYYRQPLRDLCSEEERGKIQGSRTFHGVLIDVQGGQRQE
jgi:hypothetical protein